MSKIHFEAYYHIVWATWKRMPILSKEAFDAIRKALEKKTTDLGCSLLAVGGYDDHVHALISMPPKYSISEVTGQLKGYSSRVVNMRFGGERLKWQEGFGVFTVSLNRIKNVTDYILNQETKHNHDKLFEDIISEDKSSL